MLVDKGFTKLTLNMLSLGRFGKALGPKELVGAMRDEIRAMKKEYGAVMGKRTG